MTPRTEPAIKNLKKGIKKMEKKMTAAARVRRDFQLGRPYRTEEDDNLAALAVHPRVVWDKASKAYARLQSMMTDEGLEAKQVDAAIVYVTMSNPDEPLYIAMAEGESVAMERLSRPDAIALGMIFIQHDPEMESHQRVIFPYQFARLNSRGAEVLKKAGLEVHSAAKDFAVKH